QMANAFYVFSTRRGTGDNPESLFGTVSRFGPGGAQPTQPCTGSANDVDPEQPYLVAPQARLAPTGGMEPLAATTHAVGATGLEFTIATGGMREVSDGVGTTPMGLALAPDGNTAYVANYLARNLVMVAAAPAGFGCLGAPTTACTTHADCPGGAECMPLVHGGGPTTGNDLPAPGAPAANT